MGSQILRCPDVAMIWGQSGTSEASDRGVGFKGLTWPPAVGSGLIPPQVLDKALMGVKTPWSWMLTRNGRENAQ